MIVNNVHVFSPILKDAKDLREYISSNGTTDVGF
jgi:hypothetical protein